MAFSYKEYTTRSSGQREFAFAFDAVAKDTTNIKVTIGGVHLYDGVTEYNTTTRLPGSGSTPEAEYTVSSGSITIKTNANSAAVTFTVSGVTVTDGVPTLSSSIPLRIFRKTNRDTAEVTFSSGSILADSDLNKANNQARFLSLEAVDRADESISIDGNDSTQYNIQIEGADKRIFGVATPSNANDAVPKSYADTTVASAETYRNKAQDYRDTAESYATRTDGPAQTFSGAANNSSGTGTNTSDYSAKNWAVGVHASNTPSDGSAKEWAIGGEGTVGNAVSGGEYSAKKHAQDASGSATAAAASETAAAASAAATAQIFDKFDDKYLGQMADNATATDADTTGTWAKNSSVITVASKSNIIVGQEVTGSGIPTDANVISISSLSNEVTISENMAAAGSSVDLDFRGQGVYGAFNGSKDGPALNNDGDALVSGNLYFNTTDGEMRVYDGSSWIAASAAQNATILEYVYDIAGTVTAIVGASGTGFAENNNASVSFGSNESVHVYLNGVQLIEGASDDYQLNASSNTVTFNSAVVSGDIVKIVVYKTFTVGDAVPASTGGTFSGNVTVPNLTLSSNVIKASDGGSTITLDTSDNVTIAGNLKVKDGGTIGSASDADAITISSTGAVTLSSDFVPATPLSHRNIVINGAMQVSQRSDQVTGITSGGYKTIDRMSTYENSLATAQFTHEQVSDGPDGFAKSLKITCTTAEGTVGSGDNYRGLEYKIEGQDLQQLAYGTSNAKNLTLSFYVKTSLAGTYNIAFKNVTGGTERIITKTYVIESSDVNSWEYKTVTIPGDTATALTDDNAERFNLSFCLGAGTDWTSVDSSSSWSNYANNKANYGQTAQFQNTLNATWQITGLQLELGSVATPFEHRSYGDELLKCLRYYYKLSGSSGPFYNYFLQYSSGYRMCIVDLKVRMRATPAETITVNGSVTTYEYGPSPDHWKAYIAKASTETQSYYLTAGEFDAEL